MTDSFDTHGRIKCGTVVTPEYDATLGDYARILGLETLDTGTVAADLAAAWGTPGSAGKRTALLGAPSGRPGFLRLVEGSPVIGYRPLTTFGWAAFEMTVRDCTALFDDVQASGFAVIGEPKPVPGFDNFIPFQVTGRGGEVLYLNQVLKSGMSGLDLPMAQAKVDHMFIAILAAADRAAALAFHVAALGFTEGDTWAIPYSVVNKAFGLPDDFITEMTMTQVGRMPAAEIDQYPPEATARATAPGELPPGNALISFIVDDLARIGAPFIAPPVVRDGPLYAGRRTACVTGAAGELIELIAA